MNFNGKSSNMSNRNAHAKDEVSCANENSENNLSKVKTVQTESFDHYHIRQVSEDIDRLTDALSIIEDKSNPPEVPDTVETFTKIIESRIENFSTGERCRMTGNKITEEDIFFIEAVKRLSKLAQVFGEFPSGTATSSYLNRTTMMLERAMVVMEEELRGLLEEDRTASSNMEEKNLGSKQASIKYDDYCVLPETQSAKELQFPGYSTAVITKMARIVSAMIFAGYEKKCSQAYTTARKNGFREAINKVEFETISKEDLPKIQWEKLEGDINKWINVVQHFCTVLFPCETNLCETVFSEHPTTTRGIFSNVAPTVVAPLLDFPEALAMSKMTHEKLFKFLDVYEKLRELVKAIIGSCSDECEEKLKSDISGACDRIGEVAVSMLSDLENSIKSDAAKSPVPGGAVHPLTRYTMNYLKYACEYRDILEEIFLKHSKLKQPISIASLYYTEKETGSPQSDQIMADASPFSSQLMTVMDVLDGNLAAKSMLYKDPSLRYIFLMNNGRYILQKAKGSAEIGQVMGETWCRRRSTIVRQFHKNYQRETWSKVLQCISQEGFQLVNGKNNVKSLMKERLKSFNAMFDEIHRTQSTWVVSDEQLQSELRVSMSAVMIPAYRSFIGRYRQNMAGGKHADKYIKYQPEDIETYIEQLFEGNTASMARRR